jgi:integrase
VERQARKAGHAEAAARIFGAWSACYVRYCTLRDHPWQNEDNIPGFLEYLDAREDVNDRSRKRAVKSMVFLFEELLDTDVSDAPWHPSASPDPSGDGAPSAQEPKRSQGGTSEAGGPEQSSLLTQLLFHTSLPINEALDLRAGDVDPDAGLIYVSDALGTPKRIIEMPDALSETLRDYIAKVRAERGSEYLDAPLFQAHALAGRVEDEEGSEEQRSDGQSSGAPEGQRREGASLWSYT